jgi:hypothetical protein
LKNILAFLLAFTIGSQHCVQLGLFAWYNVNKQAITEKLCVNKAKPELHCDGKCYLGKQLKKAEEGEKRSTANTLKEKQEYVQKKYSLHLVQPFVTHSIFAIKVSEFSLPSSPVLEEISPPG